VTKKFADWRLILDGRGRHGKLTLGDISSTTQCSCPDRDQMDIGIYDYFD
jgi:hypothetical protein